MAIIELVGNPREVSAQAGGTKKTPGSGKKSSKATDAAAPSSGRLGGKKAAREDSTNIKP
jgi:hypothetical protein